MSCLKDPKYTTWSNRIFSHGAHSDWSMRGQASTSPQHINSSKPSPFAPLPATVPIIPLMKIAKLFLTHPRTYSATTSTKIYHCGRFIKIEPGERDMCTCWRVIHMQLAQNRAAWLALGCTQRANVNNMHVNLSWLKVEERFSSSLLLCMRGIDMLNAPSCLSELLAHSLETHAFRTLHCHQLQ